VETAKENLRVTEVKYQAGMATQAEVVDAQAKLADAERSLLEPACRHEGLKRAFAKPWACAFEKTPAAGEIPEPGFSALLPPSFRDSRPGRRGY
jgi:hypothetical protein